MINNTSHDINTKTSQTSQTLNKKKNFKHIYVLYPIRSKISRRQIGNNIQEKSFKPNFNHTKLNEKNC